MHISVSNLSRLWISHSKKSGLALITTAYRFLSLNQGNTSFSCLSQNLLTALFSGTSITSKKNIFECGKADYFGNQQKSHNYLERCKNEYPRVVQHTVAEKARAAVHGEKRVVKIIYINLHNKPLNYNLRYDFNIFNLSCKYGVKYLENRPEA